MPGRGVPVVRAPQEIAAGGVGWLQAALLESAAGGHAGLVVDVSSTQFADPQGLRLLVRARISGRRPRAARRGWPSPVSSSGGRRGSSGLASSRASLPTARPTFPLRGAW